MSQIEKLLKKFLSVPKDLSWEELVKILNYFGFYELGRKGKTGGSRRKFLNNRKDVLILHKPHPSPIVKRYIIEQVIEKLNLEKE